MPDIIETDDKLESAPNPRDAMMNEIVGQQREDRDAEIKEAIETQGVLPDPASIEAEGSEAPPEPPNGEAPPENALESTVPPPPAQVDNPLEMGNTPIIEREGQQFLRIKVNGEEQDLAISDAITTLQKNANADLQTKLAVEARQNYERLTANLSMTGQPVSTQPDEKPEVDATKIGEEIQSAMRKLYDGDVENSAEALTKIVLNAAQRPSTPATPAMTPEQIRHMVVTTEAQIADQREAKGALDRFKSNDEFKSISADPATLDWVDKETEALMQDSNFMADNPSYDDIFTKAGKNVLARLQKFVPQQDLSSDDVVAAQVENKRSQSVVVPAAAKREAPPEAPPPKTTSDIISDMKRSRGQTF